MTHARTLKRISPTNSTEVEGGLIILKTTTKNLGSQNNENKLPINL